MVDFDRASFVWPASTVPEDLGDAPANGVDFRLADLLLRVKQGSLVAVVTESARDCSDFHRASFVWPANSCLQLLSKLAGIIRY